MGTLVIRIPEDINAECEISNSRKENVLLGAFEDDAKFMDQVVEWAMQARERDPLRYGENG
ncbi:MAG: hypothetical protein BWK80_27650 [Desulfobacteraceae bacterium IS3]|nr:MAG: hypothetical protein BWK80_27650 [Desulfobacteraceae bacterium IS3]